MRTEWTKEWPTEVGGYWVCDLSDSNPSVRFAEVWQLTPSHGIVVVMDNTVAEPDDYSDCNLWFSRADVPLPPTKGRHP